MAVVGVGAVGSATAFSLMESGVVSELVLVDADEEKAEGEAMDLDHGAYFTPPVDVSVADPADCRDADIVVVTAGANQRPGENRLDGEYGIRRTYASVPCVVNRGGAREVVEHDLPAVELEALRESARVLRDSFERTGIE